MVAAPSRRAAADGGECAALPDDLDLERVADEIEGVGDEQRHAVESGLVQVLVHLIRLVALPDDHAVRHWTKEADAFLDAAEDRYRPSMRRALDLSKPWARAPRWATRGVEIDGHAVPPLPKACPFELEELAGGDADPRGLAARLATVAAASGGTGGA